MEENIAPVFSEKRPPSRITPPWLEKIWVFFPLAISVISLLGIAAYNEHFKRFKAETAGLWVLVALLVYGSAFLFWAGLWSLAGKTIRREDRFVSHMNIALFANVAWTLIGLPLSLLGFSLDIEWVSRIGLALFFWALVFWAINNHLRIVSLLPDRRRAATALSVVLIFAALSLAFNFLIDRKAPALKNARISVFPSFLLLASPPPLEKHLSALANLQAKADARVKKDEKHFREDHN